MVFLKSERGKLCGLLFSGLERVADHLVNVGYSIVNPIGSERDE